MYSAYLRSLSELLHDWCAFEHLLPEPLLRKSPADHCGVAVQGFTAQGALRSQHIFPSPVLGTFELSTRTKRTCSTSRPSPMARKSLLRDEKRTVRAFPCPGHNLFLTDMKICKSRCRSCSRRHPRLTLPVFIHRRRRYRRRRCPRPRAGLLSNGGIPHEMVRRVIRYLQVRGPVRLFACPSVYLSVPLSIRGLPRPSASMRVAPPPPPRSRTIQCSGTSLGERTTCSGSQAHKS